MRFRFLALVMAFALSACSGDEAASQQGQGACMVGGCSGQLCVEAGSDAASTCEWTAEYGCYQKHGNCRRQASGKCGWDNTPKLRNCVSQARASGAEPSAGEEVTLPTAKPAEELDLRREQESMRPDLRNNYNDIDPNRNYAPGH